MYYNFTISFQNLQIKYKEILSIFLSSLPSGPVHHEPIFLETSLQTTSSLSSSWLVDWISIANINCFILCNSMKYSIRYPLPFFLYRKAYHHFKNLFLLLYCKNIFGLMSPLILWPTSIQGVYSYCLAGKILYILSCLQHIHISTKSPRPKHAIIYRAAQYLKIKRYIR